MKVLTMRQRWFNYYSKRLEQRKEDELIHKWSMLAIEFCGSLLFIIWLSKL